MSCFLRMCKWRACAYGCNTIICRYVSSEWCINIGKQWYFFCGRCVLLVRQRASPFLGSGGQSASFASAPFVANACGRWVLQMSCLLFTSISAVSLFFFCWHFPYSMISTGITHVPCICRLFHPAKSAPWYIGIMLNLPDENVIHLSKNRFTQQQNVLRCLLLFLLCLCLANYLSSSIIVLFVKWLVFRMNATVLVQTHNRADRWT